MPSHRRNVPSVRTDTGMTRSTVTLLAALGCWFLGCASANVNQEAPTADAGTGDGAPGADGKNTSKNDGPAGDGVYGSCDPFTNSGCSSDQKCIALQSGTALGLGCGSKGSKGEGDTCGPIMTGGSQTGDDCGSQLACFKLATDSSYTCHRICATSGTDTCPGTETCSLNVGGLNGLKFCQPIVTCQPLEQTGCPSNQACYFGTKGAVCAPTTGNKQPGDACTSANDCVKGSNCLVVGTGICSSFCSTADGGAPTCSGASTGGTLCIALNSGTGTDENNLGSCRVQP
jgi:hypothetical protein